MLKVLGIVLSCRMLDMSGNSELLCLTLSVQCYIRISFWHALWCRCRIPVAVNWLCSQQFFRGDWRPNATQAYRMLLSSVGCAHFHGILEKYCQLPTESLLDILKWQIFSHTLQVDFHGVYGTAHSAADMGGDVINVFRGDYSYVKAQQWCVL